MAAATTGYLIDGYLAGTGWLYGPPAHLPVDTSGPTLLALIETKAPGYAPTFTGVPKMPELPMSPVNLAPGSLWVDLANANVVKAKVGNEGINQIFGAGGGASALTDLTDVDLTGLADGDLLMYSASSSKWIPSTIIDLGGPF